MEGLAAYESDEENEEQTGVNDAAETNNQTIAQSQTTNNTIQPQKETGEDAEKKRLKQEKKKQKKEKKEKEQKKKIVLPSAAALLTGMTVKNCKQQHEYFLFVSTNCKMDFCFYSNSMYLLLSCSLARSTWFKRSS